MRRSSSDFASSRVRASTLSNSRTFSIAITAWSAKVDTSSICLSVKGRTIFRDRDNHPNRISLTQHRNPEYGSVAALASELERHVYSGRRERQRSVRSDLQVRLARSTDSRPGEIGMFMTYSRKSSGKP